ncbi:hypothetical protein EPO34_03405 [Patescibacteria group bacterium]|nr:MAG: hypothetical protein EPO34_03405 [Patescibacteria group bacterium]
MPVRTVMAVKGRRHINRLEVDGKIIGHAVEGHLYPTSIEQIEGTLNDGREFWMISEPLPYIKWWRNGYVDSESYGEWRCYDREFGDNHGRDGWERIKDGWMREGTFLPYPFISLCVAEVEKIMATEIEYTFFRLENGDVTNGDITFPRERPYEWSRHKAIRFVQPIHERNWSLLLDSIVGCYFDGVNTIELIRMRLARQMALERNQKRIRRIVDGQCFDPGTFDETQDIFVGIGERLMFTGLKNSKRILVVDSPNYGHALYVFDEENKDTAHDWANGRIGWKEARNKSVARIFHTKSWKGRLAGVLG